MLGKDVVDAILAGVASDAVSARVRAMLVLLEKVTRDHAAVTPDDVRPVLAAGASPTAIAEALNVGFIFNVITRLADSFAFEVGPPAAFELSAKRLLSRGYR